VHRVTGVVAASHCLLACFFRSIDEGGHRSFGSAAVMALTALLALLYSSPDHRWCD